MTWSTWTDYVDILIIGLGRYLRLEGFLSHTIQSGIKRLLTPNSISPWITSFTNIMIACRNENCTSTFDTFEDRAAHEAERKSLL